MITVERDLGMVFRWDDEARMVWFWCANPVIWRKLALVGIVSAEEISTDDTGETTRLYCVQLDQWRRAVLQAAAARN